MRAHQAPMTLAKYFRPVKRLLSPPQFGESYTQQAIKILFFTQASIIISAILILLVGLFFNMDRLTIFSIAATGGLMVLAVWLLRQRHLVISGSLMLIAILSLATYLLTEDEGGLHDIAILLFPAVIIIAGLTLNRRLLILFTSLSILSIVVVAYLEGIGRLDTYFGRFGYTDTLLDAAIAAILLLMNSIFVIFFIDTNYRNYARLEKQEVDLRVTNQRLQLALQAAGLKEWELDLGTGQFRPAEMFGQLASGPDQTMTLGSIHPQDRPAVQEAFQNVSAGRAESFELTHREIDEGGAERWFQSWGRLIRNEEGVPARIAGLRMDITDRKWSEAALQESEALYRQAIEAVDAVPYFLDHQKRTYTFMGTGIEAITGYTSGEMTPDLFNTLVQYSILIGETSKYSFDEAIQKALRGEIAIWQADNLVRTRQGTLRWLLDSAIQVRNDQGEIYGSIGILQDITERKQVENEVRKLNADLEKLVEKRTRELEVSRDRLSQALRLANMAYWEYDIQDNRIALNDQFYDVLRTTAGEAGGYSLTFEQYLSQFVHSEDRANLEARIKSTSNPRLGVGPAHQFEYRALNGKGETQYVLVDYQVIRDESNEPVLAYGYHMDITQRKLAEAALAQRTQQLESANKELESFAYTISHDLRAPLRAVQGYSRVLVEDYAPQLPPDARHFLDNVNAGALHMARLIDDLLEFSRLGRQPIHRELVNPNAILEQVIAELKSEYENRPVRFDVQHLPACMADPALLQIVYENLVSNALKYSRSRNPAIITIGSQEQADGIVYFVRDNGIGFDMSYAQKLFGVFQRLPTEDRYEGTGIGLASVQRIIHRHGGRVWAEAEMDHGATFYFTLGEADQ